MVNYKSRYVHKDLPFQHLPFTIKKLPYY